MFKYEIDSKVKINIDLLELESPLLRGEVVTIVGLFFNDGEEPAYYVEYVDRDSGSMETIIVYEYEIVDLNTPLFELWDIVQVCKVPFVPNYQIPISIGDIGVIVRKDSSDRGTVNTVLLTEKESVVWNFYDDEIVLFQPEPQEIDINDTVRVIKIDEEKDGDYLFDLGVQAGHTGIVEDIFEGFGGEETVYLVSIRVMPNEPLCTVELYQSEIERVE